MTYKTVDLLFIYEQGGSWVNCAISISKRYPVDWFTHLLDSQISVGKFFNKICKTKECEIYHLKGEIEIDKELESADGEEMHKSYIKQCNCIYNSMLDKIQESVYTCMMSLKSYKLSRDIRTLIGKELWNTKSQKCWLQILDCVPPKKKARVLTPDPHIRVNYQAVNVQL